MSRRGIASHEPVAGAAAAKMSILLPALVPALGAIGVLLTARRPALASALAIAALFGTLLAALVVVPGESLALGGTTLAPTTYGRLVLVMLAAAGFLGGLVAVAAGGGPGGLAAMLLALAPIWIALIVPDPTLGCWAILAGSVAALACTALPGASSASVGIVAPAVRAVIVAGAVGVVGIAFAAPLSGGPVPDATVGGVAFLVVTGALALRSAAVPVHGWAARLADAVPQPALAAVIAWLPAIAVGTVLVWTDSTMAPIATELGIERALVITVALATIALASLASWLADDAGHVVSYLAIATLGVALLGISAVDPGAWTPTRSWLVMGAVAMTGLAAWASAIAGAYRTRWLPDLRGWARRSPVLAVAFVVLGLAMIGAPGMLVLDVRIALVEGTMEGPLALVGRLLLLAPLAPLLRVLIVGLAPIEATIGAGRSERVRSPGSWAAAEPSAFRVRARAAIGDVATVWRLDRIPAASAVTLGLALLAGILAAGGFELQAAAAGPAPTAGLPTGYAPGHTSPRGDSASAGVGSPVADAGLATAASPGR
jgi:formate hydrogenlyase subunit 3/multisubunit Na+/H+ antiporter MnhD subunit